MELVTVHKYESIAERIKRLNSSNSAQSLPRNTVSRPIQQPIKNYVSPFARGQAESQPMEQFRGVKMERKVGSRVHTQETEQNLN